MRARLGRALIALALAGWSGAALATFPQWPATTALSLLPPDMREQTRRLGDEVRGDGCGRAIGLAVLAPSHTGVTVDSQPTLFWFTDTTVPVAMQIELYRLPSYALVLDTALPAGIGPGIHELSLADHQVSLEPGIEYEWSVAALCDPQDPAGDIVSRAAIMRFAPPPELERRLADAGPEEQAALLVEHGIWYDALEALARLIAERPDGGWQGVRAEILASVGLEQAANHRD